MSPQTDDMSLSYVTFENSTIRVPRLSSRRQKNPLTVEIEITHERNYNNDGIALEDMSVGDFVLTSVCKLFTIYRNTSLRPILSLPIGI